MDGVVRQSDDDREHVLAACWLLEPETEAMLTTLTMALLLGQFPQPSCPTCGNNGMPSAPEGSNGWFPLFTEQGWDRIKNAWKGEVLGLDDKQVPLPARGPRAERRPLGPADACELRLAGPGTAPAAAAPRRRLLPIPRPLRVPRPLRTPLRRPLRACRAFRPDPLCLCPESGVRARNERIRTRSLAGKGFGAFRTLRSCPADASANAENRHQAGAAAVLIE